MLKKIPFPLCGLCLGLLGLGKLVVNFGSIWQELCLHTGILFLIVFMSKVIADKESFKEVLTNPVLMGISATFPMSLLLLSSYPSPLQEFSRPFFWLAGFCLFLVLIIYFTQKFIFHWQWEKIFASYFVVYAGIAMTAVATPPAEYLIISKIALVFALASMVLLLPLVSWRYLSYRDIAPPLKPLLAIYAAPLSLCVVGYTNTLGAYNPNFLTFLYFTSLATYILGLSATLYFCRKSFYPSFSAFTFPLVISTLATKRCLAVLPEMASSYPWLKEVEILQTFMAITFVALVAGAYIYHYVLKQDP